MIRIHLADRGTTTFTGDFSKAYEAAQAYIRAHATSSPEQIDDDRPDGISVRDWAFYCTPAKYWIAEVLWKADQPLLTMPIAEQSRVCRSTAARILRIMELMGEARNVGTKFMAKWERV